MKPKGRKQKGEALGGSQYRLRTMGHRQNWVSIPRKEEEKKKIRRRKGNLRHQTKNIHLLVSPSLVLLFSLSAECFFSS